MQMSTNYYHGLFEMLIVSWYRRFDFIFSIDASSEATIEADLVSAVNGVIGNKSVNNAKEAIKHLSGSHELSLPNSLIIFDNADAPDISLNKFIPGGRYGYVIITTRNQTLESLPPDADAYLELEVMSRQEATDLLLKIAVGPVPAPGDTSRAINIVNQLGYLPLAVVQAGSYIKAKHCMGTYLNQFKASRAKLLSHEMGQQLDQSHRAVYAALNVTHDSLSPKVMQMLRILSFLRPMRISVRFILWVAEHGFDLQLPDYLPRQETYERAIRLLQELFSASNPWTEFDTRVLIEELQKYSLVTITNDEKTPDTLQFHRLVFAWVHDQLMQDQERPAILSTTICLLLCGTHNSAEAVVDDIVPHVQSLSMSPAWSKLHTNDRAALMEVLRIHGDAKDLVRHWKRIRSEVVKFYGADLKTSEVDLRWADACWRNGDYDMASRLEEGVVHLRTIKLGSIDPSTLSAMEHQALGHFNRGDLASAAELQLKVLEGRKHPSFKHTQGVARALEDLADTYIAMNHSENARELLTEARNLWHSTYGPDHWTVRRVDDTIRNHDLYGDTGAQMINRDSQPAWSEVDTSAPDSQEDYQGWQPWCEDNQGPWSLPAIELDRLANYERSAVHYAFQRSYNDAQVNREIVLKVRSQKQGFEHPDTIGAVDLLAQVYERREKFKEAGMLRIWAAKQVLAAIKQKYEATHSCTVDSTEALISVYKWQRRDYLDGLKRLKIVNVIKLEAAKSLHQVMKEQDKLSRINASRAVSILTSFCNLSNLSPAGVRRTRRVRAMLLVYDNQIGITNIGLLEAAISLVNAVESQSIAIWRAQASVDCSADHLVIEAIADQLDPCHVILPALRTGFSDMCQEDRVTFLSCRPSPTIQRALITFLVYVRHFPNRLPPTILFMSLYLPNQGNPKMWDCGMRGCHQVGITVEQALRHLEGEGHFNFKFYRCSVW